MVQPSELELMLRKEDPRCNETHDLSNIGKLNNFAKLGCKAAYIIRIRGNFDSPIRGLHSLTRVHDLYYIGSRFTAGITSLAGLEGLTYIEGTLLIESMKQLRSLDGLNNLRHIGGSLILDRNLALTSIDGLQNLTIVGTGPVKIKGSPKLASLEGLRNLRASPGLEFGSLGVTSLAGLRSLQTFATVSVKNTPLETLGGLASQHREVKSLSGYDFDCTSWPRCVTPHERGVLQGHARVLLDEGGAAGGNSTSPVPVLPAATWDRWRQNGCGPDLFECQRLTPCTVNISGARAANATAVFLSRTDAVCGPHEGSGRTAVQISANGTVDLTDALRDEAAGDYSICGIGTEVPGPLGQILLTGPQEGAFRATWIRGVSTFFEVDAVGLKRGDAVFLASACDATGWRAVEPEVVAHFGGDGGFSFSPEMCARMSTMDPMSYRLCWVPPRTGARALQEANGSSLARRLATCGASGDCPALDLGVFLLAGPFRKFKTVVMGEVFSVPNVGIGTKARDRMRLLPLCGVDHNGSRIQAESDSLLEFNFSDLALSRMKARVYRKCWCSTSSGKGGCRKDADFATDAGRVSVVCAPGEEPRERDVCSQCPQGKHKGIRGNQQCLSCAPGKYSIRGSLTCVECEKGYFAKAGWGQCSSCPPGTMTTQEPYTSCQLCPRGKSRDGPTRCKDCDEGLVAPLLGQASCGGCGVWQRASTNGEACELDATHLVFAVLYAVCLLRASLYLLLALRRPLKIEDVSLESGKTVVTTLSPHGLHMCGSSSFPVSFADTGHPDLDRPARRHWARVLAAHELELLTPEGELVKERLDTSRGTLSLPPHRELWHKGWVPVALAAPVFLAIAVVLAVTRLSVLVAGLSAAAAAVLAAAVSLALRLPKHRTPLEKRLEKFSRELLRWNPAPTACPRGPNRAIRLGKLYEVHDFFSVHIRDRTAYYMDSNIFRPLTKARRLSFAELAGPSEVQFFVSHFWGTSFKHFCDALKAHAEVASSPRRSVVKFEADAAVLNGWREVSYWICFCSNNQYQIADELGASWEECSFYLTLRSGMCRGTCMVLDSRAMPLTRSWCIFEVLQTLMLEREEMGFGGLLLCTSSGVLNAGQGSVEVAMEVVKRVATLDMEQAGASVEADKQMINSEVINQMGSFGVMNSLVRQKMRAILSKAQQNVNDQFDDLFMLIGEKEVVGEEKASSWSHRFKDDFGHTQVTEVI